MNPRAPVVLTRPAGRNAALAHALRAAGLAVIEAPALTIERLDTALPALGAGDLCLFVSRQAVEACFDGRAAMVWPREVRAAAVGAATARALRVHVPPDRILAPDETASPDSESLLSVIEAAALTPGRAHVFRAQRGRDWLAQQLQARGWQVQCHALYRRDPAIWAREQCAMLTQADACTLLLTSLEAFDAVAASLRRHGMNWPAMLRVVTLHERIARRLQCVYADRPHGTLTVRLSAPDDAALFQAILASARSA
ncbi:MAG: uroporphyrinogen-III synthase [Castellaniella sp.]|uniref:uroporphyrinogen-III synthase n=1 Tax=Castellaniella sp. TaxID=1955812 RepID=UPI003A83639D